MGEIIDLDSYRRQHKRHPVETSTAGTGAVETSVAANRRGRNRGRSKRDRVRPAVEPFDRDPAIVDPEVEAEPDDTSAD